MVHVSKVIAEPYLVTRLRPELDELGELCWVCQYEIVDEIGVSGLALLAVFLYGLLPAECKFLLVGSDVADGCSSGSDVPVPEREFSIVVYVREE